MNRRLVSLFAGVLVLVPLTPVLASGDLGCSVDWTLVNPALTGCDNFAALAPGNDTLVNLLLLLFDRDGVPAERLPPATDPMVVGWRRFRERFIPVPAKDLTGFTYNEGLRCRSNESGAAGFEAALDATPDLPPDEHVLLLAARKALMPTCNDGGEPGTTVDTAVPHLHSAPGQAFAAYLSGAAAFYDGRFDEATAAFSSLEGNTQSWALRGSAQSWLADAAAYMIPRVDMNRLQVSAFDQYGSFKGGVDVDQQAATRTEASLESYIRNHPDGKFVASARGLLRRINWLAGRTVKLAAQYAALIAVSPTARDLDDAALAEEIDNKLLLQLTPQMTQDPILLASFDLLHMRPSMRKERAPITVDELEAQRPAFSSASSLFDFLLAVHAFYIDHTYATVLKLLPDATVRRDGDYLWFSRQILRGLALDAVGDRNARGFWIALYQGATRPLERPAVELGLAIHDENHGRLRDVFAAGSPVDSPGVREMLLKKVADAALLRQQAHDPAVPQHERDVALFALLYKEVTRERYEGFVADVSSVPPDAPTGDPADFSLGVFTQTKTLGDFGCPPLRSTALQLAHDPHSARGRLCLAEFVRVNELDTEEYDTQPPKDQLGGTPSLFPGKPYARAAVYQAIIADETAPDADRAFALFRSVTCYASTGVNHCGSPTVPLEQRKAWFFRLKQQYPLSHWAQELHYWW